MTAFVGATLLVYIATAYIACVDQRAYMVTRDPIFTNPGFVANEDLYGRVTVVNVGKTPARKTFYTGALVLFPLQTGDANSQRRAYKKFLDDTFEALQETATQSMKAASWIPWGIDIPPGGTSFIQSGVPIKLSDAELKDIKFGHHDSGGLHLVGLITYVDIFGVSHETQYCWYHIGTDDTQWIVCHSHNYVR